MQDKSCRSLWGIAIADIDKPGLSVRKVFIYIYACYKYLHPSSDFRNLKLENDIFDMVKRYYFFSCLF